MPGREEEIAELEAMLAGSTPRRIAGDLAFALLWSVCVLGLVAILTLIVVIS